MNRLRTVLLSTVWALGLHANAAVTQPPAEGLPRPVIRDSAGVRIVEYPTLAPVLPPVSAVQDNPFTASLRRLPLAIRVEPKPYLDLGGIRDNEAEEFNHTHPYLTATQLSSGVIVVNDRNQLKFFDAKGTFIRAVGRRGRGPGEFEQTEEVCLMRGDSLLVRDIDGRMSVWDSRGGHVRTYARFGRALAGGCRADGAVVVPTVASFSDGRPENENIPYRLARPDGTTVRELGRLPALRFAAMLMWSPSIIPRGDELYVASARTWEIRIQSLAGRPRQITRLTKPVPAITDAEWRRRSEGQTPRDMAPKERASAIARRIAQQPSGPYPALSIVHVDPKHRVWVSDFESFSGWTILDATGVIRGRFFLRGAGIARVQLVGVGANHIVVLEDDDEGGVHLRFYRFSADF